MEHLGFFLVAALVVLAIGICRIIVDNTTHHDLDWEDEENRHC